MMFHFGNYAVPSWHHLRIQIGRWNGTIFLTIGIFGFKISRLQLRYSPGQESYVSSIGTCFAMWQYVAHLPEHCWVRRMLAWNPALKTRQVGRPRHMWGQKVQIFCCYKQVGHWRECARDEETWFAFFDTFHNFCKA